MARLRKWKVVSAFPTTVPTHFEARNVSELQRNIEAWVQELNKAVSLPFKDITFRVRGRGPFEQLQVFFVNRHHSRTRFMKLEEVDLGVITLHISTALKKNTIFPLVGIGYSAAAARRNLDEQISATGMLDWTIIESETREIPYYAPAA